MHPLRNLIENGSTLSLVIFAFFIGACLAGVATVYHRRTIGALVRYLLDAGACSPETAKTLYDAEQELNIFVRLSLRKNVAFRRLVAEVPPADGDTGKKRKLSAVPLYIRPEEKERAEKMYAADKASDANLWMVLLSIAVFGIIAALCAKVVPYLVNMLTSFLESL